ncbi:MAG: ComEC family competence protein [Chitinophagaceae bacterium]|nr:ComEC family competence protein [Chitinophagaceae bacterium]
MEIHYYRKQYPFLFLLLPFIAGLLAGWYLPVPETGWLITAAFSLLLLLAFFVLPLLERYRHAWLSGVSVFLLLASLGALHCQRQAVLLHTGSKQLGESFTALQLILDEPLTEKEKSWKTVARVSRITYDGTKEPVTAKIIVYLQKDSTARRLGYGTRLLIRKNPSPIGQSGNPGGFDFRRYCFFQGITHQVYLGENDYLLLPGKKQKAWKQLLITASEKIRSVLHRFIPGKKETGIAEALLLGYKAGLDRDTMQSYMHTGVVHIIAISGLHLGLIYWLLRLLFRPLRKCKGSRWLAPLLIIGCLWVFSLLTGAQPSVLRSALMFSCLITGETIGRKNATLNALGFSAFLLLWYNPFWLWDAGFQLSYTAVLGILLFQRPVSHWLTIRNPLLSMAWEMTAVTIAAQLLTLPVCLYLFHQFPLVFLLSNFVAVPLSSALLLAIMFLCCLSFIPPAALFCGQLISAGIGLMNMYVAAVERIPFSSWEGFQLSPLQTFLLLLLILAASHWLLYRAGSSLFTALLALFFFSAERAWSFYQAAHQQVLIVYQVPGKTAIDFISRRDFSFRGDSSLQEGSLADFSLRPARLRYRVTESAALPLAAGPFLRWQGKSIIHTDQALRLQSDSAGRKQVADLLLLSGNPRLYLPALFRNLQVKQVVSDASVPAWKARYWQKDCDSLGIPFYPVREKGAFVMTLN